MAWPQPLRLISQNSTTPAAVTTAMAAASVRASSAVPSTVTAGMPMMPLAPPVNPRHSIAPCSTTNAKASVTMARYGPDRRNAGSASAPPTTAARTPAAASAGQKLSPRSLVRRAVT